MKISDVIEQFLKEMMEENDGVIEIRRNDLATQFHCVPSQINYVIATRFKNEHGYAVDSRRGGGGSVRIRRVQPSGGNIVMHLVNHMGDRETYQEMHFFLQEVLSAGILSERECKLLIGGLSDRALGMENPHRDAVRARALKNALVHLIS